MKIEGRVYKIWRAREDSNLRHPAPEAGALSTELRAHNKSQRYIVSYHDVRVGFYYFVLQKQFAQSIQGLSEVLLIHELI